MDYCFGQFLLMVLSLAAAVRLVLSCYQSPRCEHTNDNTLKTAVQEGNRTAVCRVLPLYMQCLQEALDVCHQEPPQDLAERSKSTRTDISKLKSSLELVKIKYRESCDETPFESPNSAKGSNSGNHNYWVVSLAGLIILTLARDVM